MPRATPRDPCARRRPAPRSRSAGARGRWRRAEGTASGTSTPGGSGRLRPGSAPAATARCRAWSLMATIASAQRIAEAARLGCSPSSRAYTTRTMRAPTVRAEIGPKASRGCASRGRRPGGVAARRGRRPRSVWWSRCDRLAARWPRGGPVTPGGRTTRTVAWAPRDATTWSRASGGSCASRMESRSMPPNAGGKQGVAIRTRSGLRSHRRRKCRRVSVALEGAVWTSDLPRRLRIRPGSGSPLTVRSDRADPLWVDARLPPSHARGDSSSGSSSALSSWLPPPPPHGRTSA